MLLRIHTKKSKEPNVKENEITNSTQTICYFARIYAAIG
ncbi:hypothetical protein D1BOALGB6SA_7302 [Olavius sp. associated proteobacterium Delta 1]|nr:hypothetical protein D1BOALGB6SA_7302 [Olavius sp. associated proteobacterium Delta 1]